MSADRATLLNRAAQMRREPTEAEQRLWRVLSRSQLDGHTFRRQATIGNRIADFFCPAKCLIVEVDGETHDAARDQARDDSLARDTGFVTVRFSNAEVIRNIEGVVEQLRLMLSELPDRWSRSTTPGPSSEEEGRL